MIKRYCFVSWGGGISCHLFSAERSDGKYICIDFSSHCVLYCALFSCFFLMKETLFSTCHTKGASFSNSQTNLLMSKETNSAGLVWRRMLLVCFLHKFSNSSSICFTTSSLTVLHNTDAFMMALQEVLNKPRAKYFTTFAISPWTVFFRSPEG